MAAAQAWHDRVKSYQKVAVNDDHPGDVAVAQAAPRDRHLLSAVQVLKWTLGVLWVAYAVLVLPEVLGLQPPPSLGTPPTHQVTPSLATPPAHHITEQHSGPTQEATRTEAQQQHHQPPAAARLPTAATATTAALSTTPTEVKDTSTTVLPATGPTTAAPATTAPAATAPVPAAPATTAPLATAPVSAAPPPPVDGVMVYVYELPDTLGQINERVYDAEAQNHDANVDDFIAQEAFFLGLFRTPSAHVTTDPLQANVFIIPVAPWSVCDLGKRTWDGHCHREVVKAAIDHVKPLPTWNGGKAHFVVTLHDHGLCGFENALNSKKPNFRHDLQAAYGKVGLISYFGGRVGRQHNCYRAGHDVVVLAPWKGWRRPTAARDVSTNPRSKTVYFRGSNTADVRNLVVSGLHKHVKRRHLPAADYDVEIGKGHSPEEHARQIGQSLFCLDLPGRAHWTFRTSELLSLGCVPVSVDGETYQLPYPRTIAWGSVSIVTSGHRDDSVLDLITANSSPDRIAEYQRSIRELRAVWNFDPDATRLALLREIKCTIAVCDPVPDPCAVLASEPPTAPVAAMPPEPRPPEPRAPDKGSAAVSAATPDATSQHGAGQTVPAPAPAVSAQSSRGEEELTQVYRPTQGHPGPSPTVAELCSRVPFKHVYVFTDVEPLRQKEEVLPAEAKFTTPLVMQEVMRGLALSGSERSALTFADFFRNCSVPRVYVLPSHHLNRKQWAIDTGYVSADGDRQFLPSHEIMPPKGESFLTIMIGFIDKQRKKFAINLEKLNGNDGSVRSRHVFVATNPGTKSRQSFPGGANGMAEYLGRWKYATFGKSRWHAKQMMGNADRVYRFCGSCNVLYNPVMTYLGMAGWKGPRSGGKVDADKLVFMSSPNKGLKEACDIMKLVVARRPTARLVVYGPSYMALDTAKYGCEDDVLKGHIEMGGSVGQAQLHESVASSFAVLFPAGFKETFGCSHVEANCLGTPVLAMPTGAMPEVLLDSTLQLVDSKDPNAFVDRLEQWWKEGRPLIRCNPDFTVEKSVVPLLDAFEEDAQDLCKLPAANEAKGTSGGGMGDQVNAVHTMGLSRHEVIRLEREAMKRGRSGQ